MKDKTEESEWLAMADYFKQLKRLMIKGMIIGEAIDTQKGKNDRQKP